MAFSAFSRRGAERAGEVHPEVSLGPSLSLSLRGGAGPIAAVQTPAWASWKRLAVMSSRLCPTTSKCRTSPAAPQALLLPWLFVGPTAPGAGRQRLP